MTLEPEVIERVSGPVLFARYAFPPNHLGYCGPADAASFWHSGIRGDDHGLRRLAGDFDGALPHLQVIADSAAIGDPLDGRVVEAYWLGGSLLDKVRPGLISADVETVLRGRCGPVFDSLAAAVAAGAVPHHSLAVFAVYPWIGMLGDERRTRQAMIVLDRCRIRSGQVLGLEADHVVVESTSLIWDGGRLGLGDPVVETVRRAIDGVGLSAPIAVGDRVALHWDWVCDKITETQGLALQTYSRRHLDLVNGWLAERHG
jgi:hypothetical protein